MSPKVLKKINKQFEETLSFEVKSGKGRKSVSSRSVEDMVTILQDETNSNVQRATH